LAWYQNAASRCGDACRVPRSIAAEALDGGGWLFVLEDLDAAGFPGRRGRLEADGVARCLRWLAAFHATFLGTDPDGLWEIGTYWHLDTRPDELEEMPDGPLKGAAAEIDRSLNAARFRSFVHGDAKVANFCFAPDGSAVAAVDFQYVGGGCGMKDVAYFLGSCLDERECEAGEQEHLAIYFEALHRALADREVDAAALEAEWRALYPLAWTDFYRFLAGWCPGHPKMNPYSERLAREVVATL
jgi:Ser/Thr protein kinase RdoA (MazF antagonist)